MIQSLIYESTAPSQQDTFLIARYDSAAVLPHTAKSYLRECSLLCREYSGDVSYIADSPPTLDLSQLRHLHESRTTTTPVLAAGIGCLPLTQLCRADYIGNNQ